MTNQTCRTYHQCTVDVFAIFSPVFSLRIFYKKHAKNHTSNKPRAFKICVQLSFDKLIWYTKFHKDWSTRRQKHHWSKFFDGLVKYRTENRKTVHCALLWRTVNLFSELFSKSTLKWSSFLLCVQMRHPKMQINDGSPDGGRSGKVNKIIRGKYSFLFIACIRDDKTTFER